MAVLAIDLGYAMGWGLRRRGNGLTSGVVNLRHDNPDDGTRLLAMRQWLTGALAQLTNAGETLDAIYYEKITFIGKNNTVETVHAHGEQLGNLKSWAALKKAPRPIGIPWDKAKKHITGHRSASRETILDEIRKRFPEVCDHNQASAVAVLLTAEAGGWR